MEIPSLTTPATQKKTTDFLETAVPAKGDPNLALIAFVGEAPGWKEMTDGEPFVGSAGEVLDRVLNILELPRYKCYFTNFCKTKLPKNDEKLLLNKKGWRHESFPILQKRLIEELSQLSSPLIVLFGDTAMQGLIDSPRFDKITKFDGSIYRAEEFPHLAEPLKGKFIMPCFHPASALPNNQPKNFYYIIHNLSKILALLDNPSLMDNPITTHIEPTLSQVLEFYNEVSKSSETSFDIECTPKFVTCFALTCSPSEGMSIPLINNSGNYWTEFEELQIWQGLAAILEDSSIAKIMQNGMFDTMFILRTLGIKTSNFLFDTMLAQHLCWADLSKGLDRIVSTYTYHPYYKDEGKQTFLKLIKDWPQHWNYNAKDAILTHQAKEPLIRELDKLNLREYFFNYLMPLHKPLMEMEYRGILTDREGISSRAAFMSRAINALQNSLNRITNQSLNVNSSKQMISYFYGTLGIKPYINRKTKSPTCDDLTLTRIANKRSKGYREAKIIQKIREFKKLLSTYFEIEVDSDSRLRCQYEISGTNTGRLSSKGTFFGTGSNIQNQPPAFKKYLIPDPGYILAEIDLRQAEAVIVAYVSQDANMLKAANSDMKIHTYVASQIFNVHPDDLTKEQYKNGKRTVHAKNYGMGYVTMSLQNQIPQSEAKYLLQAYDERFPGLARWHKEIFNHVSRKRILYNLFGRPKRFLGNIESHSKDIFAYIPQSTVGEVLNRGLIKISEDDELYSRYSIQLLAQVHDSVLFQFPDPSNSETVFDILNKISVHLNIPITHKGHTFELGQDGKISKTSWAKMLEVEPINLNNIISAYSQL